MARPLDDPDRLQHMYEAAEKAVRFARGKKRADIERDDVLQLALTHLIMIIGEAASRITAETRDKYAQLPWKQMIGMRHRLIHDYYAVNLEVLWLTVKDDLRPLIESLKPILGPKRTRRRR
jgi:uncharacterized protein with HEPN domain